MAQDSGKFKNAGTLTNPAEVRAFKSFQLSQVHGIDRPGYWVYALISDARPIYVGQTSDPLNRFHNHLKTAYGGRSERGRLRKDAAKKLSIISMLGLSCLTSRIEALAYETAWARAIQKLGYKIENAWGEHSPGSTATQVPYSRLLDLNLSEAHALGLSLRFWCKSCYPETLTVPISAVMSRIRGNPKAITVAQRFSCPSCDRKVDLEIHGLEKVSELRRIPDLSGDAIALAQKLAFSPP
jgi:hypothetical protein